MSHLKWRGEFTVPTMQPHLSRRAQRLENFIQLFQTRLEWIFNARLLTAGLFLFFLILATLIPKLHLELPTLILGPSLFIFLVLRSQKIESYIHRLKSLAAFYERQNSRQKGQPHDTGLGYQAEQKDLDNPLNRDLDIIGPHSLFHLMDETFTHHGSEKLLQYLLHPTLNVEHLTKSQNNTRTLTQWPGPLRRLVVEGHQRHLGRASGRLSNLFAQSLVGPSFYRDYIIVISLFAISLGTWIINLWGLLPNVAAWAFLSFALFSLSRLQQTAKSFNRGQDFALALEPWIEIYRRLENLTENPAWPEGLLAHIARHRPSRYFVKMNRWLAFLSIQSHPLILILFNVLLPWNFVFSRLLEAERKALAQFISECLEELHSLEVLQSYAFVLLYQQTCHPEFVTPEKMRMNGIYHPLVPRDRAVANSFMWTPPAHIALITGSNMSGKSTFLRTIGLHQVLALAGAPVYSLEPTQCAPLPVFTCLRVSDSVNEGFSSFYAEVTCVKAILDQAAQGQILFLIDEIFRGTNNKERLIGSHSVLKELLKTNSFGFISTHDLELTGLAKTPTVENWHFREDIEGNNMIFRYELQPGPCPTTNALKVMELVGLPIHPI